MGEQALAVDVGGTKIAYALIDGSGRVLDSGYVLTDRRGGRYVVEQVRDVVSRYSRVELAGVGVSVAGAVRGGAYVWAPNIRGWRWVDQRSAIQDSLGRSTRVEVVDDRVASVLGEVWQGSARGLRNVVTLIIGTGVGAGIMVEGVAVRGSSGVAGAVGWWLLSRRCRSRRSRRGFLEEVIGGVGLSRVAARYASEEVLPGKTLREVCGELDARCLFKAYDLGTPFAARILRRVAEVVGILVANLVSTLNPEAVVLCGSVGVEMGRRFMDVIRGVVEAVAQPLALGSCSIRVSTLADLLPALKCRGSREAGRFGVTSPLPEGSTPGRVSGPLPLSQTGLGAMDKLPIIALGSQTLSTHHRQQLSKENL